MRRPELLIAAIGRSGSTMLANWLTTPPDHFVFHEPSLTRERPTRLLGMQLDAWGVPIEAVQSRHWGIKEVENDLQRAFLETYRPRSVIICVRDMREVAQSFLEKHRRQAFLDRYPDAWTADFCIREAAGLVALAARLERDGVPVRIARYEEFGRSPEERARIAAFVGWPGGGDEWALIEAIGRGFEQQPRGERGLAAEQVAMAEDVAARCGDYQRAFGYL